MESLKKSNGIMVVRGRTLPELTLSSHRSGHGGHRSDLRKEAIVTSTDGALTVDFSGQ